MDKSEETLAHQIYQPRISHNKMEDSSHHQLYRVYQTMITKDLDSQVFKCSQEEHLETETRLLTHREDMTINQDPRAIRISLEFHRILQSHLTRQVKFAVNLWMKKRKKSRPITLLLNQSYSKAIVSKIAFT